MTESGVGQCSEHGSLSHQGCHASVSGCFPTSHPPHNPLLATLPGFSLYYPRPWVVELQTSNVWQNTGHILWFAVVCWREHWQRAWIGDQSETCWNQHCCQMLCMVIQGIWWSWTLCFFWWVLIPPCPTFPHSVCCVYAIASWKWYGNENNNLCILFVSITATK